MEPPSNNEGNQLSLAMSSSLSEPGTTYTGQGKSEALGVSTVIAGEELRNRTEGTVPAVFRQNSIEYDIRVMFDESEKDLMANFDSTFVPNQNFNMIPLSRVAKAEKKVAAKTNQPFVAKTAKSKACSVKADEQKLHGKARQKFREECKKAA